MFMILNALKAGTSVRRVEKKPFLLSPKPPAVSLLVFTPKMEHKCRQLHAILDKVKVSSEQSTSND